MHDRKTLQDFALKHGDMIYLSFGKTQQNANNQVELKNSFSECQNQVELDEVDKILFKQDGLIQKGQDAKFCQHGTNAKCIHCTPIEPYDEGYMKEHNIKHMSFHSYIRKQKHGIDKYLNLKINLSSYLFIIYLEVNLPTWKI